MLPLFVDTDQHLTEPPDFWTGRISAKFADRAPRFMMNHPTMGPGWSWDGGKTVRPMGVENVGSEDPRKIGNAKTYEEIDPACYDPKKRVEALDVDGAGAAILFPNGGRFFHSVPGDDFYAECTRAYNNASIDWCKTGDARRLLPSALLPMIDAETAIGEMERTAKLGFKHFMASRWPSKAPLPLASDDPLWAAAQDTGMVMSVHGFGASRNVGQPAHVGSQPRAGLRGNAAAGGPAQEVVAASRGAGLGSTQELAAFVFSGVLERFPRLKVALIETSVGWLPYFAERMDALWLAHRHLGDMTLKRLPSDYLADIWASFDREWLGLKYRNAHVGTGKMLFATDFPHIGSFYPHTRFYLELAMQGVPAAEQEQILWSNAATLYGIN